MLTIHQIEEVKSYFDGGEEEDCSIEDDIGPDMIFQPQLSTTANELITALPQRPVVDKMISIYFKAPYPSRRKYYSKISYDFLIFV